MKKSTKVALILGGVAVASVAAVSLTANASSKNKLPKSKPPRTNGGGEAEETADGTKVRRPVAPKPEEAQWADLEQSVAIIGQDAQWRFALPESRADLFAPGETVTLRIDTANGLMPSETVATEAGFNIITRTGPTVTFNRDSGVLQIYPANYAGRLLLRAGDLELAAWVLSPKAKVTMAKVGWSKHIVDQRVDGVWQVHAFAIDDDGNLLANESGEFLDQAAAISWADTWIDENGRAAA